MNVLQAAASEARTAAAARRRGGFTLVEIALALAVVVIGLLAVFALITAGLSESGKAVADTQAAQFADSVFNSLAAGSQRSAEAGIAGRSNLWGRFWFDFGRFAGLPRSTTPITIAAYTNWMPTSSSHLVYGDGFIYTNYFAMRPLHNRTIGGITNHMLRYRIRVRPIPSQDWYLASSSNYVVNTNVSVTMEIWDGAFGPLTNALEYYAEFDNPGDL